MELMKALGIAKDCIEERAEMWEESVDDNILFGDVLERQAIAIEQRQALQEIDQFMDNHKSFIEDTWGMK